jgi:O-antigen ligase
VSTLAQAGSVAGCAGLGLLLVATRPSLRIAGLVAWGIGLGCLAAFLAPDLSVVRLAAAVLGGLALVCAGAWALLRWPYLLPILTLAGIPLRIPVEIGDEEANLLLPLYGVVGAYAIALAWQLVVGRDGRSRELGPAAIPLAAFALWVGISLSWSADVREGAIFVGAFVLPFGLLAIGFARLPWRGRWLTWLWAGLVATALLYASVGMVQWVTRDVFWNPKVIVGNAYAPFFRVNSIFWDPSIYGRYLTIGILTALAGILLGGVRGWRLAGLYVVIAAMWVGLVFSFSQSSFAALGVGVVVAALVVWGRRSVLALVGLLLVIAVGVLAVPSTRERIEDASRSGIDAISGDRATLVGEGVRITIDEPLVGVGVGGFRRTYADRLGLKGDRPKAAASHTTPVTVATETGLPGLVLFAWVVVAATLAALRGLGRGFTSRVSFAVGLTLVAIVVHSLAYNAMFEDPMTWAAFGLVGLATSVPRRPPAIVMDGEAPA